MPDNAVSIKIGTDLSQLEADSKKIGSALKGAASGGIAGFERVQQRVIVLTKQLGELRNALLQTNDPARQAQLNAALSQTSTQLQAAKTQMRGMSLETREANEKAQMLAAQFGVRLPQGLGVLLARMPAVQAAMAAAFNATIILAVLAAIVAVIPKLDDWMDKLRGIETVTGDVYSKVAELNRFVVSGGKPEAVSWLRTELRNVTGDIQRVEAHIKRLTTLQKGPETGAESPLMAFINRKEVNLLEKQLEGLKKRYEELGTAIPTEKVKEFNKAAVEGAERAAKALAFQVETTREDYARLLDLQEKAVEAEKAADQMIIASRHEMALQTNKDMEDQVRIMEEHGRVFDERIIRQSKEAQEAAKDAARAQEQMLEATAGKIESFIDRVFLTARSLSDVFHQFLMQILGSFVKWISQMLASWLTGIRQATAGAGGGGGGGLLGSLLRGVFGLGGAGVSPAMGMAGTAMATGGGGWVTQAGQAGLPVGMGGMALSGGGGIPQAVGGAAQGTLGNLAFQPGQLAANLATMGPLLAILGGASLMGRGGVGSGVAGGMLAAGGASYAMFGLAGLDVLPLAIGALVGGLIGMFRRGRQKRKAAGLEQGFEFAANDLFEQFKQFKIDYESALSGMQALISQGQESLTSAGLGRWGRQGAENLTRVIQDEIRALEALQKQREARATFMAGMTIPEFAVGGQVPGLGTRGSGLGGGILAILHPGEFVMRQQAVDALGTNFLAALNRAPRFDSGGMVPSTQHPAPSTRGIVIENLNVYPERGMSDREAAQMVVRGLRRAERDGAL
jgi:hypothetical protein